MMATTSTKLLLPLRCTSAAGLIQVRGAKRRFDGNSTDPYNYLKRKLRMAEKRKFERTPLISAEAMKKKLDLPYFITSLNQVIATVVPLEKFAKAPLYTKLGVDQRAAAFKENFRVIYEGGVIKKRLKKVDPFRPVAFARRAQELFIEVNHALLNKDKRRLQELTTENATEAFKNYLLHKNFTWEFVEELERPRVISARVAPMSTKDNLFAQLVVRIKSKQLLALYSPSGALLKGDPHLPKEVTDYVVFERHLVEPEHTSWRILAKLPPQRPWREVKGEGDRAGAETEKEMTRKENAAYTAI